MEPPSTVTHHHLAQPSLHLWHCQEQALALPSTLMDMEMVLASSSVLLLVALPALPPSTSPALVPPPAWTALLATPPLALALLLKQTALPVLLAVMLQQLDMSAAPALMASTSPALAPPPAWVVLLA
jgi:hypothetical protein